MATKYWFPAKPPGYGWGWGWPRTWQGWVVVLAYCILLATGHFLLVPQHPLGFLVLVLALTALLLAVCWFKGERPGQPAGKKTRP